jgi:hypothetical protein
MSASLLCGRDSVRVLVERKCRALPAGVADWVVFADEALATASLRFWMTDFKYKSGRCPVENRGIGPKMVQQAALNVLRSTDENPLTTV